MGSRDNDNLPCSLPQTCLLHVLLAGALLLSVASYAFCQTSLINGSRVISGTVNWCGTTGGSATAYTCTFTPAIANYRTGARYAFNAHASNTGAATMNLNGIGVKTIKKMVGGSAVDLVANDIRLNHLFELAYDGTNMVLVSQYGTGTQTIASGTKALNQTLVATGACGTAQTVTATGTLATDTVLANFNANETTVTGYTGATTGTLRIDVYPSTDTINFVVCNNTAADITPGAVVTLNWRVLR
jgi:hypothetical protein